MTSLHTLRRSHGLSLTELARRTGIPARRLAEFEYEARPLKWAERQAIAVVFDVAVLNIAPGIDAPAAEPEDHRVTPQQVHVLSAVTAAAVLVWSLRAALPNLSYRLPPSTVAQAAAPRAATAPPSPTQVPPRVQAVQAAGQAPRTVAGEASATAPQPADEPPTPSATPIVLPTATMPPTPTPEPAQPHRCPLLVEKGTVVVTQGYEASSHVPAAINGAIDLAVDGDGNGFAEPDTTRGAIIVATHGGTAKVTLNSWPAGNHIWIDGDQGWRSGYSHLQEVYVKTGDSVRAGQPVGVIGNTGRAGGPHLDLQVWKDGVNVDPTGMLDCR